MAASPFEDVSISGEGALTVIGEDPVMGPMVVGGVIAVLDGRVPAKSGAVVVEGVVVGTGVMPLVVEDVTELEGWVPTESGAVVEGIVAGTGVVVKGAVSGLRAFVEDVAEADLASTGCSGAVEAGAAVVEGGGEGLGAAMLLLKRAVGLIFTVPLEEKNFSEAIKNR